MKVRIFLFAAIFACLLLMVTVQAQDQSSTAQHSLHSVDNQGIRNYLLGPGEFWMSEFLDSRISTRSLK